MGRGSPRVGYFIIIFAYGRVAVASRFRPKFSKWSESGHVVTFLNRLELRNNFCQQVLDLSLELRLRSRFFRKFFGKMRISRKVSEHYMVFSSELSSSQKNTSCEKFSSENRDPLFRYNGWKVRYHCLLSHFRTLSRLPLHSPTIFHQSSDYQYPKYLHDPRTNIVRVIMRIKKTYHTITFS